MSSDRHRSSVALGEESDKKETGRERAAANEREKESERAREQKGNRFFFFFFEGVCGHPKGNSKRNTTNKIYEENGTASISNEKGEVGNCFFFLSIISKGHFYHYKLLTSPNFPRILRAIKEA